MTEKLHSQYGEKLDEQKIAEYGKEQRDRLAAEREQNASEKKEINAEEKRQEALEAARKVEQLEREKKHASVAEKRRERPHRITTSAQKASFNKNMHQIQSEMPAPSRTFSKIIHNPVVEKISEGIGNTVARPNVLLAGSLTAFIFVTVLYVWAKFAHYPLSGFETIGAFFIGFLAGIIIDFLRILFTGKAN